MSLTRYGSSGARCGLLALAIGLAGCLPYVSPPVHGKIGVSYSSAPISYAETFEGVTTHHKTDWPGYFAGGFDIANVAELPFSFGFGAMAGFATYGAYVDGGPMWRVLPNLRIGTTGGAEAWTEENGFGVRTGVTIEYTGRPSSSVGSEVDMGNDGTHNKSTSYYSRAGAFAIGMFIDVGHRWVSDGPNNTYVSMGLSFRLAAIAGVVDMTEMH